MSSSNSPCAACKYLRRKCTQECDFAPYFLPESPQRFANVHRVFGASNVAKLLKELNATDREDAVKSLAYEAESRIKDPVYGCVGLISMLQQRLKEIQHELHAAKKELSSYNLNPQTMQYLLTHPGTVI
ncbi:LOB domain-containing protein 36-like, partial [Trifolium medium]|nr:LOB domain-containing protein 36-like [Trifolium medium]